MDIEPHQGFPSSFFFKYSSTEGSSSPSISLNSSSIARVLRRISNKDNSREAANSSKLQANTIWANENICRYTKNIQPIQNRKLNTPRVCIRLISLRRYFKFLICPRIMTFCSCAAYLSCRFLTRFDKERKRFV